MSVVFYTQLLQEVLQRGEKLENVQQKTANLLHDSKTFKTRSKAINFQAMLRQLAPVVAIVVVILLFIYLRFFS